jgi:hypothetical protein
MPPKKGKAKRGIGTGRGIIRDRRYNPERARKLREENKRGMELLRKIKQKHKKRNKK